MPSLHIPLRGPFALEAAADFLMGFTPASGSAALGPEPGRLALAFRLDETFEAIGVSLLQRREILTGALVGTRDVQRAEAQVARILSVDQDGSRYPAVGERDPVIGGLMRTYGALRPVCFGSPYEAGVWGILAQRVPMRVAAGIKKRMADEHGDAVEVGGHRLAVFPGPERVLSLNSVVGLPEEKLVRLKAIAEASLEGRLDAERLRGVPREEALADLNRIRGVGAWTAGHILVRGAGTIDDLALEEPRVLRAIAHSYGLTERPTVDEAQAIAELWRPFRTWVTVLLVVHLNRTGNWNEPSERTRAEGAARPSVPGRRSARSPRS